MSESEANVTDGTDLIIAQEDFKTVYADWQAVRIIRDNYWDSWKLYLTFYTWFSATMAAVAGYILSNRPFDSRQEAFIVGAFGLMGIITFLFWTIFMFFISKRIVQNIHLILARTKEAVILADKIIYARAYVLLSAATGFGLVTLAAGWTYLMFFFYVRKI
jgi:hypothetical protein